MNEHTGVPLELGPAALTLLPEGAVFWRAEALLVVSDLHLGKAERMARRGGTLPPPYETTETLERLSSLISRHDPGHVLCLGDSFDDLEAARALPEAARLEIARMMAGRRWTWVLGNHDPGPADMGGTCRAETRIGPLAFRHIAHPEELGIEVSGHYHPKAGTRGPRRPAFVTDGRRLILPAFGTYTGGMEAGDPVIANLMAPGACAVLTGRTMAALPLAACTRPADTRPPGRWSSRFA